MTTTPDALALADELSTLAKALHDSSMPLLALDANRAAAALRDLAGAQERAEALAARVRELEAILRALLDADERGQGQPWQDAMERARAALGEGSGDG